MGDEVEILIWDWST
ncbi:hypothetical protein NPIL_308291, partial [Nephila pilipes]